MKKQKSLPTNGKVTIQIAKDYDLTQILSDKGVTFKALHVIDSSGKILDK